MQIPPKGKSWVDLCRAGTDIAKEQTCFVEPIMVGASRRATFPEEELIETMDYWRNTVILYCTRQSAFYGQIRVCESDLAS